MIHSPTYKWIKWSTRRRNVQSLCWNIISYCPGCTLPKAHSRCGWRPLLWMCGAHSTLDTAAVIRTSRRLISDFCTNGSTFLTEAGGGFTVPSQSGLGLHDNVEKHYTYLICLEYCDNNVIVIFNGPLRQDTAAKTFYDWHKCNKYIVTFIK